MTTSVWYQGESLKRLLQGAAVGVVATLAIGFGWGGWMLATTKIVCDRIRPLAALGHILSG